MAHYVEWKHFGVENFPVLYVQVKGASLNLKNIADSIKC